MTWSQTFIASCIPCDSISRLISSLCSSFHSYHWISSLTPCVRKFFYCDQHFAASAFLRFLGRKFLMRVDAKKDEMRKFFLKAVLRMWEFGYCFICLYKRQCNVKNEEVGGSIKNIWMEELQRIFGVWIFINTLNFPKVTFCKRKLRKLFLL